MKNLVLVTVAVAAVGYSFAAQAQKAPTNDAGPKAPRTLVEYLKSKGGSSEDTAKPGKRAKSDDGSVRQRRTKVSTARGAKADQTAQKRSGRKAVRSAKRQRVRIDTSTTASVGDLQALATSTRGLKSAATGVKTAELAGSFNPIIARYAAEYGVPVSLAHAVIRVESNYRVSALGSAGEIGLMQIKPATARMMGYSGSAKGLYNPDTNIRFGMKYLAKAHNLGGGDTCSTILRYNAGHAATRMNPISSAYCVKVKQHLAGL